MGRAKDTATGDLFASAGVRAAVGLHADVPVKPIRPPAPPPPPPPPPAGSVPFHQRPMSEQMDEIGRQVKEVERRAKDPATRLAALRHFATGASMYSFQGKDLGAGWSSWLNYGEGSAFCHTAPGHMAITEAGLAEIERLEGRASSPPPVTESPKPEPAPLLAAAASSWTAAKHTGEKKRKTKPEPKPAVEQPPAMRPPFNLVTPQEGTLVQIGRRWHQWTTSKEWKGWKDLDPYDRTWINHSDEPPVFGAKGQMLDRTHPGSRDVDWMGHAGIPVEKGAPEPYEVVVRGARALVVVSTNHIATYAADPDAPFWSYSGFYSFNGIVRNEADAVALIESHIDGEPDPRGPNFGGGLGGQLEAWAPQLGSRYTRPDSPPEDDPDPEAPNHPETPGDAPGAVSGAPRAPEPCQVRGALERVKLGVDVAHGPTTWLFEQGLIEGSDAEGWKLTAPGQDELNRLDDEHYAQLDEEAETAIAEGVEALIASGDLEPDEVMENGEAVQIDPEPSHHEVERGRKTRLATILAQEWEEINQPADELTKDEATPEALALFGATVWIDDCHRYRTLHRLRTGRARHRQDDVNMSTNPKKKPKPHLITPDQVNYETRVNRCRPLQEIVAEAWIAADAYDRAWREGGARAARATGFEAKMSELRVETNQGNHCGSAVYDGPRRLEKALRIIAKRQGRLPMWGIKGKFRIELRGMKIIVDESFGLGFHLDTDHHKPGDPSFSDTGYRSFTGSGRADCDDPTPYTPESYAQATLESYIDQPKGRDGMGGLGGHLEPYWPWDVERWQDAVLHSLDYPDSKDAAELAAMEAKVRAMGIDPLVVTPRVLWEAERRRRWAKWQADQARLI